MRFYIFIYFVLTISCTTTQAIQERRSWENIEGPSEIGGLSHTTCFADSKGIHIFSGIDEKGDGPFSKDGFTFNPDLKEWFHWPDKNGPSPVQNFAFSKDGDEIFIFGGQDAENQAGNNFLFRYNFSENNWIKLKGAETIDSRWRSTLLKADDILFIYGGKGQKDSLNTAIYDIEKKHTKILNTPPSLGTRTMHISAIYGDKILIYGGFLGSTRKDDGFLYDYKKDQWSPITKSNLGSRVNAKSILDENKLYIIGGNPEKSNQIFGATFDFDSDEWNEIPGISELAYYKGYEITLMPSRGIVLWGGRMDAKTYNNTIYFLDFQTNTWSKLSASNPPPGTVGGCLGITDKEDVFAIGGIRYVKDKGLRHLEGLWMLSPH